MSLFLVPTERTAFDPAEAQLLLVLVNQEHIGQENAYRTALSMLHDVSLAKRAAHDAYTMQFNQIYMGFAQHFGHPETPLLLYALIMENPLFLTYIHRRKDPDTLVRSSPFDPIIILIFLCFLL